MKLFFTLFFTGVLYFAKAAYIILPMDLDQKDHLKAYGITYWVINQNVEAYWLLNYKGDALHFLMLDRLKLSVR